MIRDMVEGDMVEGDMVEGDMCVLTKKTLSNLSNKKNSLVICL